MHSRTARVLTSPLVTVPLFLASLYGLYYTPLFDWAMGGFVGHTWMLIHFLIVGLLLFWPILAIDPSPHTHQPVIRILELFITAPFHAFFGIAVMSSTDPARGLGRGRPVGPKQRTGSQTQRPQGRPGRRPRTHRLQRLAGQPAQSRLRT